MLVDTHAHLQWASFNKDRETVISRARKVGVENIVNIGFDADGSREAIELAEKHEGVYATVGIHPHNASQLNQNLLDKLRRLSENPKVVAMERSDWTTTETCLLEKHRKKPSKRN